MTSGQQWQSASINKLPASSQRSHDLLEWCTSRRHLPEILVVYESSLISVTEWEDQPHGLCLLTCRCLLCYLNQMTIQGQSSLQGVMAAAEAAGLSRQVTNWRPGH